MHRWRAMPVCLRVASAGSAESIILSAGGAESMMLSVGGTASIILSAHAKSIILSTMPTESMILSALLDIASQRWTQRHILAIGCHSPSILRKRLLFVTMITAMLWLLESSVETRNPVPNYSTKQIILSLRIWYSDAESIILSAANSGGYRKNINRWLFILLINDFGQQRLNGATNWSAAKGGQVLPHFDHIVSGVLTPPCPIAAVF